EPDAAAIGQSTRTSVGLKLVPDRQIGEEVRLPRHPVAPLHGAGRCGIEVLSAFGIELTQLNVRIFEEVGRIAVRLQGKREQVDVQCERNLVAPRVTQLIVVVGWDAEIAVLLPFEAYFGVSLRPDRRQSVALEHVNNLLQRKPEGWN